MAAELNSGLDAVRPDFDAGLLDFRASLGAGLDLGADVLRIGNAIVFGGAGEILGMRLFILR